jgi:ubiquinone/menaquinone biosynthesis C-methylase UbiE
MPTEPRPSVALDVGCGTGTLAAQLVETEPAPSGRGTLASYYGAS